MSIDYARLRDEALVSTDWLAANLNRENQRIVDMRKGDVYLGAHIPGAVANGASPFLRDSGDVIGAATFASLMANLGVGKETSIVAYDDGNGLFAARLWWVARYYGHARIKVLDGGWDAWLAEGRATTIAPVDQPTVTFDAWPQPSLIASTEYVRGVLANRGVQLLDVRGDDEWTRAASSDNAIAGHIPGARHLVWSTVIDASTKRLLPGEELRRIFVEAGLDPALEVVPYCQGGIRAAHTMLALHLAGIHQTRNYEGSWAAWSKSGLPIESYDATQAGAGQ